MTPTTQFMSANVKSVWGMLHTQEIWTRSQPISDIMMLSEKECLPCHYCHYDFVASSNLLGWEESWYDSYSPRHAGWRQGQELTLIIWTDTGWQKVSYILWCPTELKRQKWTHRYPWTKGLGLTVPPLTVSIYFILVHVQEGLPKRCTQGKEICWGY